MHEIQFEIFVIFWFKVPHLPRSLQGINSFVWYLELIALVMQAAKLKYEVKPSARNIYEPVYPAIVYLPLHTQGK